MDAFSNAETQRVSADVDHASDTTPPEASLSRDELRQIGRAVGLSPRIAAAAAAAATRETPDGGHRVLWAPAEVVRERLVRGPVLDEVWEAIGAAARAEFGFCGVPRLSGRAREWSIAPSGRGKILWMRRLSVEPVGANARLTLFASARLGATAMTIVGGCLAIMSVFVGALALGIDPDFLGLALEMASVSAVIFGGTHAGLQTWAGRQQRRSDAFLDRVAVLIRDAATDVP